jgi:ligand-binding sensor domain-containing protein
MSNNNDTQDLPVLLRTDDLPIPAPDTAPRHEVAVPCHPQWLNLASQCHIRSLSVDPIRGDLWLATGGGILRWWAGLDRFTRYASEHGLPGNSIKSVIVDGNGQPWATHETAGISYLNDDTWQTYIPLAGIPVNCLCVDRTGQLWVGTDEGLYGVKAPADEPTRVELPLHSPPPRSIAITTPDDIWLCTAQGISHRQNDAWKRYNTLPTIITLARQGNNLWLGTLDGLIRIDLTTSQSYPAGEPRTEVSALVSTDQGVWVACGRQVGLATEDSWTPVSGKACDRVTSLVPAHDNGVWIGSHSGLQWANSTTNRFQLTEAPPDVVGVRSPNEPPTTFSNLVQALAVQHLPNTALLWIGTARGLFRLDQSTETWRRPGQLVNQDIRAVTNVSEQSLWVSSWSSGLYNVQSSNFVSVPAVSAPITALTAGVEFGGWAGGLAGIYGHDGTAWSLTVSAQKLPEAAWVRALTQTKSGCLWIGTSAGLLTYNPSTKILASAPGALGIAHIQSLLIDPAQSSDILWVGTRKGLYHGQLNDWQLIAGLENRAITALIADRKSSRIWVGTDRGLFCLGCTDGTWSIADEFTIETSGIAHDRITALILDTSSSDATRLWIGTPCGLSAYSYESG